MYSMKWISAKRSKIWCVSVQCFQVFHLQKLSEHNHLHLVSFSSWRLFQRVAQGNLSLFLHHQDIAAHGKFPETYQPITSSTFKQINSKQTCICPHFFQKKPVTSSSSADDILVLKVKVVSKQLHWPMAAAVPQSGKFEVSKNWQTSPKPLKRLNKITETIKKSPNTERQNVWRFCVPENAKRTGARFGDSPKVAFGDK